MSSVLPNLRAITVADLHNLVFQRDYRIVPAISRGGIRKVNVCCSNNKGGRRGRRVNGV